MYDSLIEQFGGSNVVEFNDAADWQGAAVAYRLREDYEDETSLNDRLDRLVQQPNAGQIRSLIIGAWSGVCEGDDASEVIKKLVAVAPKLTGLRSLFIGELTYEECEISWIKQGDVGLLLKAYPQLEEFRVRGGENLSISRVSHPKLKSLAIETGGLPRSVLRELFLCELPELNHLELLLGEENYGFDGSVQDLQPLLSGRIFPKLKYLGLMNSAISDEIAALVVNSPIINRIDALDLSLGNLTDEGVRSLHHLANVRTLQRLDISHHYASPTAIEELRQVLSCELIAQDEQDPNNEWRPIVHAE